MHFANRKLCRQGHRLQVRHASLPRGRSNLEGHVSTEQRSVEVTIGSDHLQKLEAVAAAASDLKRAEHDNEFAFLFGGVDRIKADLFMHVASWESFASQHLNEDV